MSSLLRRYQQPILIAITLGVIATFILYWNGPMGGRMGNGSGGGEKFGSIYGRTIYDTDVERDLHKRQVAYGLGLSALVESLSGNSESQEAQLDFVVNMHVLDHEADALQIAPSDQEIQDEEAKVPAFQTDGKFDPRKLSDLVGSSLLPSLGFTDAVIDELVGEQVKLKKLAALVGATVDLSPAELANRFAEANEKMSVAVIQLNTSDVENAITVSDADAQKAYDARKEQFRSEEQRKVAIGAFELTPEQKHLTGKARTDALQELGSRAWSFAQAVVDKNANFAAQAKTFRATLSDSGPFSNSNPSPALANIPAGATNAYKLSPEYPSSDVLEGENGYYVLHLEGVVPSAQLTFDQAKPQVIAEIKKERAAQIMQTRATAARAQILAEIKGGKSLEEAAKDAAVTVEEVPTFSLMEANKLDVPDVQSIIDNAVALNQGQFSEFVPTATGGIFVYMKSREPMDATTAALGQDEMRTQFLRQKQEGAFLEWLRLARQAAQLEIAHSS
jgi:peptidyl-prolyl cis-trans isomerase D